VADLRTERLGPADVVLANLTGGLLEATAPRVRAATASDGRLILSGLTTDEEDGVLAAFAPLVVERRGQEDEWVCVTLVRSEER
jgi:ribosomal protein L11 methylase PrmA